MSKTNNRLGKDLVDRVSAVCPSPYARVYVKRKLLTLVGEDRDAYLSYLEDERANIDSDDKLTEGESDGEV